MRKAALLFNPESGGNRARRQAELDSALARLRRAGIETDLILSQSREDAAQNAQQAINRGCDTIFACGGDGTIHNLVQVLARSQTALAILPMGTANALAHDLGLPLNPVAAAEAALHSAPRRVALGRVQFVDFTGQPGTRYFVVAAGIGVDAHLFYKFHAGTKRRIGMAAYYAKAWQLWLTHQMAWFHAEYTEKGAAQQASLTELLAVRIRNFGGVLRELAPGASLERNDLRLVLCRTSRRSVYLRYVAQTLLGVKWQIPGVELARADRVSCRYEPPNAAIALPQPKVYVETDGDLLGTLPVEISIVPDALTILVP